MAEPEENNPEDQEEERSSRDDFNRAGMYMYGVISGVTFSMCLGIFSFGMYMNPDASSLWLAGTLFGLAGAAGGIYEVYRYAKDEVRRGDNSEPEAPPSDEPDQPGPSPQP